MGAVINFAQVVSDALGAIFGWEYQVGGGVADDMEYGAGAAEDMEDALGGAAKKAKDLNRYIAGWHEVNNMTSDEDSKGSGSGSGAGAGSGAADGGQWLQTESLWEKYTSDIDSLYALGSYISGVLTDAMNDIDWDSIYEKAENFGSGLAEFLNGLIKPELFGGLGTTIAGALNTALHALDSFGTEFDWANLGNSIAAGVNDFFDTFDFKLLASTLNTWGIGILTAAKTALEEVNWIEIGTKIGTLLEDIEWLELLKGVVEVIKSALLGVVQLAASSFSVAPLETAIALGLAGIALSPKIKTSIDRISGLAQTISTAFGKIVESPTLSKISLVTVGIVGLAEAFDYIQDSYLQEVADKISAWLIEIGVTETTQNLQNSADSLENLADGISNVQASINADNANIDDLVKKYLALADQSELTATQQLLLKDYAGQLVTIMPELSDVINAQTGEFSGNKDAVYEAVEAHKKYAEAIAYQELISQYNAELAKAEVELQANAEKYDLCRDRLGRLGEVLSTTERGTHEQSEALKKLGDEWGVQLNTWEAATDYYGAMEEGLNNCKNAENEFALKVEEANQKMDIAKQKYNEASGALDAMNQKLAEIDITLPEQIVQTLLNGETSVQDATIQMLSAISTGYSAKKPELNTLFTNLGIQLPSGLISALSEKDSEVQKQAIETIGELKAGVDISDDELLRLYTSLGSDLPASLISAMQDMDDDTYDAAISLLGQIAIAKGYELPLLIQEFNSLGVGIIDEGFIPGIESRYDESQNAVKAWSTLGVIGALDKEEAREAFEGYAAYSEEGFRKKLESLETQSTPAAMQSWATNGIMNPFTLALGIKSPSTVFSDYGKNTVEGFNKGVSENEGSSKGVISTWVSNITSWFTDLIGIASPSKVFTDFGQYTVEGFNNGIQDEMNTTYELVEKWSDGLLSHFDGKIPSVDISVDTSKYQFKPASIDTGKINGQIKEELSYLFGSDGLIDYDRLGEAMYEAQDRAMKENPLQVGDDQIFGSVQKSVKRFGRQTGKNPWPVYAR